MSLVFGAATSDRVNCGSGASLDNLTAFTWLVWVYVTTITSGRTIMNKAGTGVKNVRLISGGGDPLNTLDVLVSRATASASTVGSADDVVPNTWQCFGVTYDETDGVRIFKGSLTSALVEVTYSYRDVGSGATTADDTGSLILGNNGAFTLALQGRLAVVSVIPNRLTLAQLRAWQFRPRSSVDSTINASRLFMHLGLVGTGTQPD